MPSRRQSEQPAVLSGWTGGRGVVRWVQVAMPRVPSWSRCRRRATTDLPRPGRRAVKARARHADAETVARSAPLSAELPHWRERLVRGRRARALGLVAGCLLVILVIGLEVAEGPNPAYIGVLTAAPLLAAVFARPRDVLVVGVVAVLCGQGYTIRAGVATSQPQLVRLAFILMASGLAVLAAALREVHERQLQEVTDVAEAAQAAILRPVPPSTGSLVFAARYRSAAAAADVGGDFYDVASTPYGVRIVVGDVRGKGLGAVQLAASVLGSFREAAFTAGPDLAQVARAASAAAARSAAPEDFVTAVFVELDPHGRGRLVRCGHPVPLVLTDAGARPVDCTVEQAPLGLVVDPVSEPLVLGPGERLLLFTDGLSEARDASGEFFDVSAATTGLTGGTLDAALERLVAAVTAHTGGRLGDDLALLLTERQDDTAEPAAGTPGSIPHQTGARHPARR